MNIYQSLYDLVNQYIYGNAVEAGTYMELVCIIVATAGCLFVMALPFILVYRIIKFLS